MNENDNKNEGIETAAKQFRFDYCIEGIKPFGKGHIHDTYRVETGKDKTRKYYILQRINQYVFSHPSSLMENIVRVTGHIRKKLEALCIPGHEISRRVLNVIFTQDGNSYYKDPQGNYWRAYDFITGGESCDMHQSPEQLYHVAYAFGDFLKMLQDFPSPPLHETIPHFHNGLKRLRDFEDTLKADTFQRAKEIEKEIDFLYSHSTMFKVLPRLVEAGEIPFRVTHNDTKIDNIIMDKTTGEGICVIDLDTVMPGLSLYDFGDLGRTALSIIGEDEKDLSALQVEKPRLEAILKGYLDGTGGCLTETEKEYMVFSIKMMTLMIGMRFLTDYLAGDKYFRILHPGQNLDRARRQFKLVESILEYEEKHSIHQCEMM